MTRPAPDADALLCPWLARWRLVPDGPVIATAAARLRPVRQDAAPRMLKVALSPEEEAGGALLEWWAGEGAVRVRAREGPALLMDRAEGVRDLAEMARSGADVEAALILAALARRLHATRPGPLPALRALRDWFAGLAPAAARHGGLLARASAEAEALLAVPQGAVTLHGDLHHGNALDFGEAGWRAIDPKGLWGEPAYDLVPLLLNPDLADPSRPVATRPGRLARLVAALAPAMRLDPRRLLRWTAAGAGLSAAWSLADGHGTAAATALAVAEAALAELDR